MVISRGYGRTSGVKRVRRWSAWRPTATSVLIEELATDSERVLLARLRPEQGEVYLAGDPELLARYRAR